MKLKWSNTTPIPGHLWSFETLRILVLLTDIVTTIWGLGANKIDPCWTWRKTKYVLLLLLPCFFSSDKIIDHVIYQFIFWSWNDGSGLQVANTILIYILWFPAAFKDHQVSPCHPLIVVKTTNAMAFLLSRRKAALLLFYGAPLLLTLRLATVKFFFATFLYIFFLKQQSIHTSLSYCPLKPGFMPVTTCHSNFQRLMKLGLGTGMSKKGHFPSKIF